MYEKNLNLEIVRLACVYQTVPELSLTSLFLLNKWAFQSKEKQILTPESFVYKSQSFFIHHSHLTLATSKTAQSNIFKIFQKSKHL